MPPFETDTDKIARGPVRRAADSYRLLDAGLIPVSKVSLTSQSRPASLNLGPHDSKTEDDQTVSRIVTAVNGTPCIAETDGDAYYLPLKLIQVKKTDRKNRPQISTRWAIPEMTEWFGLHELPTKKKRHLALAA